MESWRAPPKAHSDDVQLKKAAITQIRHLTVPGAKINKVEYLDRSGLLWGSAYFALEREILFIKRDIGPSKERKVIHQRNRLPTSPFAVEYSTFFHNPKFTSKPSKPTNPSPFDILKLSNDPPTP